MPVAGDTGPDDVDVVTWHYGLIAKWWALFNLDGPEIEFFRPFVEAGQPALDAACGTGRLLVPWVVAGLDVDGVDASADMIAGCQEAAELVGQNPTLYVQPLHRLELARRYGAIVLCGGFGLGATREQDLEGLHRLFAHVRPGGILALDYEVGEFDADRLRTWRPKEVDDSPPEPPDRRLGRDGCEYALRHRTVAVDLAARRLSRELQAWQWSAGKLVAHETHSLVTNAYSPTEIGEALGTAGFENVRVVGGYHGGPPTGDERFLVYLAHRSV